MNRLSAAALLLSVAGMSAGEADACLLCGMFGGYGPYGAAPFGSAFYGPQTYTAGYGGAYGGGYYGPRPGQIRRANRRAFRQSFFGMPSYGYFPSYAANYGYAPAYPAGGCATGDCGAAYAPQTFAPSGCTDCGAAPTIVNSPVYAAPADDCGCNANSYVYPSTVVPASGCPGGNCGASYPPAETIQPIPTDTYSVPSTGTIYDDTGSYDSSSYSSGGPPPLPPGAIQTYDGPTENAPGNHSRGTVSPAQPYSPGTGGETNPPEPTFEGGGTDGNFRGRTDGGGIGGSRDGGGSSLPPDPGGDLSPFMEPERMTPADPRGNNGGGSGEEWDFNKPNSDLYPAQPSEEPVKPKRDINDAAGLTPSLLNLADRPVDSGVRVARGRLRVRARYGLPSQIARRFDLERGVYSGGTRLAAKP